MTLETWLSVGIGVATVAAIVIGPILALRIQRKLDIERGDRDRKLWVFKTLMSYRATQLAPQFVQALNLIELEFNSPKEKDVRDAWKVLLDHFTEWGRKPVPQPPQEVKADIDRAAELVTELLWSMAKSLGYDFDKVYLKKGAYYPQGLGNVEQEQHALRKGVLNLLAGQSKLPVAVFEQKFAEITANPEPDVNVGVGE